MGLFTSKKVGDAMTERPRALTPQTSGAEAARAMETEDVGALPVIAEDGRLAGIVTDRDLAIRVLGAGRSAETPVGQVISEELVTVGTDDSLQGAMDLMARHQVRRLPVVDDDGQLIGMLALADLAAMADEDEIGQVVEAISEGSPRPRV
jgi:CBS domain-containing protein